MGENAFKKVSIIIRDGEIFLKTNKIVLEVAVADVEQFSNR